MPAHDATSAELAVLKTLWDEGPSTIREISDLLYPGGGASHYATVQKLLERLEGKRFVSRETSGRAHRFAAAISREHLIALKLEQTAATLCEGSMTPLLTQLVRKMPLDEKERAKLRAYVAKLDHGESEEGSER